MAALAAGIVLATALSAPLVGAATRARYGGPISSARTVEVVVDGVSLIVRSPSLPRATFVASRPDDALQGAVAVSQLPYREFSVRAYPFGAPAALEGIGAVEPQALPAYRAKGPGRVIRALEVPAMVFGHRIEGSVRVVDVGLGDRRQPTEVVSWLTDEGGRLWIIRSAGPLPRTRGAEADFAAGTSISANNAVERAPGPRTELARVGGAPAARPRVTVVPRVSVDPPAVHAPRWWSGVCDVNNHPGSFPLSNWDGLTACGPGVNRGGMDVAVSFFPGAWGELEWECVELSMRWMYLEYGVRPYAANGAEVVANYTKADGGDLMQIVNDGSTVPRPGDVLSLEPISSDGHTAVVTATNVRHGHGTVSVLEQNMNGGNGTNTLSVVGNVVQPDFGMPVTEWLQSPNAVAPGAANADPADLVRDGGLNHADGGGWRTERGSRFAIMSRGRIGTRPYEGNGFGMMSTSLAGGGIYQDISFAVTAGESFCADAEVVTAGRRSKGRGIMTIWLLGTTARESSQVKFGPLPGGNRWTSRSTCVTATRAHSDIRIQFYDDPKTPPVGIDAVDVHQSLVDDGGFNLADGGGWRAARGSRLAVYPAGRLATSPYEGNGFAVVSTSMRGGGIYQDVPFAVRPGESFCADAEVVTAGRGRRVAGNLTIWLRGTSSRQSSRVRFGPLPGENRWTSVSTCVTATRPHSDIRVQFYDSPRTQRLAVDAVDLYRSLVANGGLNHADGGRWRAERGSGFAIESAGKFSTRPYEGDGFGVTSTSVAGGGIYEDIAFAVTAGESFCADAEVVTAGLRAGAGGNLAIWLIGESRSQSSTVRFEDLPGRNRWSHISTCVTATSPHSDIRVQFYDSPGTPRLGIDAVDVR